MAKVYNIFFSPTGGTRYIAEAAANRACVRLMYEIDTINITDPAKRVHDYSFEAEDIVVVGVPTYAGKIPNKILPFFKEHLSGSGTRAVAIVTYGNRSFDNSLKELTEILKERGFKVDAAGAFVSRHVFSDRLAAGRPSYTDMEEATRLVDVMLAPHVGIPRNIRPISEIPGDADAPYYAPKGLNGESVDFLKAKPKTQENSCINCKACAESCPMSAIDFDDVTNVPGTCIKCHACIMACPTHSKYFDDEQFLSHKAMLEKNFVRPERNYLYVNAPNIRNDVKSDSIGLGIASMVLGIISLVGFCSCTTIITGIIGIVFGIIQIARNSKKSMAITGIITSALAILAFIIYWAIIFTSTSFQDDFRDEFRRQLEQELLDQGIDPDEEFDLDFYFNIKDTREL